MPIPLPASMATVSSAGPYYINRDGTFENHLPSGRVTKDAFVWAIR